MQPVYRIDVADKLVRLLWREFPCLAEVREVVDAAVADPQFEPGMNFLWDHVVDGYNTGTIQYLRRTLHYLQLLAEGIGPHSWAIVGHTAAEFGRGRVLEAMSDGTNVTIRAFRNCEDAEAWLRNPIRYDPHNVEFPARNPLSDYRYLA
jgi:hypothetical protein